MKNILNVIALLLLVGGGIYLYQMFMGNNAIHVVEQVQHELSATEEFVFSRDTLKFSEIQNNKKFLAHVNYVYTWEASVPFGFASKDLAIDYDKSAKRLTLHVTNLHLYPFHVDQQKSVKTSEFAWLNQGDPVAKFWEGINARTTKLVDSEFKKDAQLRASIGQITRNSLIATVTKILGKLGLGGIEVAIVMDKLKLYDGTVVDISGK